MNIYEELAEQSRRGLLGELLKGPCNVSDLVAATGLKQPNVSNHLARLRAKGLVRTNKVGRQVYYTLASTDIESVVRSYLEEEEVTPVVNMFESSKEFAKMAVRGDETGCLELTEKVLKAKYTLVEVYQDFLGEAMANVGTWYKVEAIDEAQEHMASEITERMLSRAIQYYGFSNKSERSAILGCGPGARHIIGLRMIADYLRYCGWQTKFLGADVPAESFLSAVKDNKADVVLLNCNASESIEPTLALIRHLSDLRTNKKQFLIGVGGGSVGHYPESFQEAGADFTARDLKSFAKDVLPEIEAFGRVSQSWSSFNRAHFGTSALLSRSDA